MRTSFLILLLALAACAKPNYVTQNHVVGPAGEQKPGICPARFSGQECVSLTWEKMPTETEVGSFVFKVYRSNLLDGTPVVEDLNGEMNVVLWMPGMGHGSSPVTVQRLDVGTYRATRVFFTMKGEWEIRFQVKVGTDVQDQAVFNISI